MCPDSQAVGTFPAGSQSTAGPQAAPAREIRHRDVTLPAGTVIPLVLDSYVASDTSRIESPVRAHVRRAVVIDGTTVIPAGSALVGHVTRGTAVVLSTRGENVRLGRGYAATVRLLSPVTIRVRAE